MQDSMVHKVLLIVATANIKYNQMQLLRADRWPTILLCKVQIFKHFEKITLLLYNKVLKLGKPVSINTQVQTLWVQLQLQVQTKIITYKRYFWTTAVLMFAHEQPI